MPSGHLYLTQFDSEHDFAPFSGEARFVIIASTPRCGSHLLGHTLYSTGQFGFPLEYFQLRNYARWQELLGASSVKEVLSRLAQKRTSPNGVFGLKLHYGHLEWLAGRINVAEVFSPVKVLHMRRRDLLGQAISYSKALQTKSWIAEQPPVAEAYYDQAAIDQCMCRIAEGNAGWEIALAQWGCDVLPVWYEDFIEEPDAWVDRIASFAGVQRSRETEPLQFLPQRQGGQSKEVWRERYRVSSQAMVGKGTHVAGGPTAGEQPSGKAQAVTGWFRRSFGALLFTDGVPRRSGK